MGYNYWAVIVVQWYYGVTIASKFISFNSKEQMISEVNAAKRLGVARVMLWQLPPSYSKPCLHSLLLMTSNPLMVGKKQRKSTLLAIL
ncbi:hypothetical protein GOP47_0018543 [Adiantum capillus-veneris]|uniref:Uncharacterized protein n=1 Tax=Adiantum capillus-veneris TaxID=13818 RepID=A0A9D4Z8W0_ADICA|nr:hypothetical protein GOP47_0018543 [Adiantum capillus-veneris]